ncbi:MAG: lysyl oxidase family protein [Nannocystaceae bacterium]
MPAPRRSAARRLPALVVLLLACGRGEATSATATASGATTQGDGETTSASDATGPSATSGPADAPPPTPTPRSPADGEVGVSTAVSLCWDPVADPEGEAVRYRVFVDGMELSKGILGEEPGHEGPCVGPLDLNFETTYAWEVLAFEADDPAQASAKSAPATFTTRDDGLTGVVFADDFSDELAWELSGDARSGAWIRGIPTGTTSDGLLSQPGRCDPGGSCLYTGTGSLSVAGGETIATSPAFDLEGAAAATVELRRFFFKSEPAASGALALELLTPDPELPGGFAVHPLEQLADASADDPHNRWTPREYAACDAPMVGGSRLRLRAANLGPAIVEAAIDAITVRAHADATICAAGPGAYCRPSDGLDACPDALLCCGQGVVNAGVYRCAAAVPGLDYDAPPPTQDAPNNGALGCDAPDLILDGSYIEPVIVTDIDVTPETCELAEGCLGGVGQRRVLLFTAATPNVGSRDLVMGIPANHPELFHHSPCHDHYHFEEFARYELLDSEGVTVVAEGHKQAFCMLDSVSWAWPLALPHFTCENQGISRGFTDSYDAGLPCQWVDVTGLPPGDYTLRIRLNQPRPDAALPILNERDYSNNTLEATVTIP